MTFRITTRKSKPRFMLIAFALGVLGVVTAILLPLSEGQEALVFFAVLPLGILGWVVDVIVTGEFGPLHGTGGRFTRSETPVRFWAAMVFSISLALMFWVVIVMRWRGGM